MSKLTENLKLIKPELGDSANITATNANWDIIDGQLASCLKGVESTIHPGCFYRIVDGEHEWFNPPMEAGAEYKTTERWGGKPVYVMRKCFNEYDNANLFAEQSMGINLHPNVDYVVTELIDVTGFYVVGGPTGKGRHTYNIPNRYTQTWVEFPYTSEYGTAEIRYHDFYIKVDSPQTLKGMELVVKYTK